MYDLKTLSSKCVRLDIKRLGGYLWAASVVIFASVVGFSDTSTAIPSAPEGQTQSRVGEESAPVPSVSKSARSSQVSADDREENSSKKAEGKRALFERVFGRDMLQRSHHAMVAFFINGVWKGQTRAVLSYLEPDAMQIDADPILQEMANITRPEALLPLQEMMDANGLLTLPKFSEAGFAAEFDHTRLKFYVEIPPELLRMGVYDLNRMQVPTSDVEAARPSSVSGYVNLNSLAMVEINESEVTPSELQLNAQGAINILDVVLEGEASYQRHTVSRWPAAWLRLVRDVPEHMTRYMLGDAFSPTSGFLFGTRLFGLSVAREFSLNPYFIAIPRVGYQLYLERPAVVDIQLNGTRVDMLRLPAGEHDLRNLALSMGANELELLITDDLGRKRTIIVQAGMSNRLLASDLDRFSIIAGLPASMPFEPFSYELRNPTLVALYERGLSRRFTAGGYLYAAPHYQLVGLQGTLASIGGNLSGEVAASRAGKVEPDFGARLQYEFLKAGLNSYVPSLNVLVEYRAKHFLSPGQAMSGLQSRHLDLTFNVIQRLFWNIRASANLQYGRVHGTDDGKWSVGGVLSRALPYHINLMLSFEHRYLGKGIPNLTRGMLLLSTIFPKIGQSLTTMVQQESMLPQPYGNIAWDYWQPTFYGRFGSSARIERRVNAHNVVGRVNFQNHRATLDVLHSQMLPRTETGTMRGTTQINVGTAVAFAGPRLTLSAPISENFAMIIPNKALEGQEVGINPSPTSYAARTDFLGPAVISNLRSYYLSEIRLTAPDLPVGYSLGPTSRLVWPTYKSGVPVHIGKAGTIFLRGVLKYAPNEPVVLQSGTIVMPSDPAWKPLQFFTNRTGRFAIQGVQPGEFAIYLQDRETPVAHFEIPADAIGLYDLDVLQIE